MKGFPGWDRQWEISRFGWICVLKRVAASASVICTAKESWWKKLVKHPEGTGEDGFTGVQRNIYQKEIWPQYKLVESNVNHSRYVSTNYEIFGLIEKQYPGWLNFTNKNRISLTTQIPFSNVSWEFGRMKKTSKMRDAGGVEQWNNILTRFRDTATRSNGFKVIRTRACPISARVASIGDLLGLFTGAAPSGRGGG